MFHLAMLFNSDQKFTKICTVKYLLFAQAIVHFNLKKSDRI